MARDDFYVCGIDYMYIENYVYSMGIILQKNDNLVKLQQFYIFNFSHAIFMHKVAYLASDEAYYRRKIRHINELPGSNSQLFYNDWHETIQMR